MPYSIGTVSTFANKLISVAETIGTGTGSQLNFGPVTLSKVPIFMESLKIRYTIGSTLYYGTTSTSGVISGTYISSGSVTEAGVINLTFSQAPDNGTAIQAYEYKTKGVLEKCLDFVRGTKYEETIGTGNGSETEFSITLAHTPVSLGQCRIRFKIAGVEKEVWDDGEGHFNHTDVSYADSSFNNTSGELILKFNSPITNGYAIKALYCTGSEGQDWMVLREENSKNASGTDAFSGLYLKECVLKNSGLSYKEFHCVGIRELQYLTANLWDWNLNLYPKWDSVYESAASPWNGNSGWSGFTGYDTTYQNYTSHPSVCLKDDESKYWVITNKRRIIVIARVSGTLYMSCYLGGTRRLSSPSRYPLPSAIIGNIAGNYNYSSTSLVGLCCYGNTFWASVKSTGGILTPGSYSYNKIVPSQSDLVSTGTIGKTRNNEIILYPNYFVQDDNIGNLYRSTLSELDGVFNAPDKDVVAEDTITIGGDTYLVIPNVYRTTNLDYIAVKLE